MTDLVRTDISFLEEDRSSPLVIRAHLHRQLTAANRITSLSAPAGSGKTTLVSAWLAATGLEDQARWVTVRRGLADPQELWLDVLGALAQLSGAQRAAEAVTAAPDLDLEAIIERVSAAAASLPGRRWLVIDDLHELESLGATAQLEQWLARAPVDLRFILITRRDLSLGLHRRRVEGQLTELREGDLRFGTEDAQRLFAAAGLRVSAAAVAELVARTEGWAVGLRLAALSLAGGGDPERLAAEFSGAERTVAEYMLNEVIDQQPDDVRRLLLYTSILDRVSADLADHLTGDSGGQRILSELERAGAFVVSLDAAQEWFRTHRLLADLLSLELRRTAPAEIAGLHERAAVWLDAHDQGVEAIRHAQAAENWRMAAHLLANRYEDLYLSGRQAAARELLSRFPASMLGHDLELSTVAAGDAMTRGALEDAERHLADAERLLGEAGPEQHPRIRLALVSIRLILTRFRNDLPASIAQAQRLLAAADSPQVAAAGLTDTIQALALTSLGSAELWLGELAEAQLHLQRAVSFTRVTRPTLAVVALTQLAIAIGLSGRGDAEAPAREALGLITAHGWADEQIAAPTYLSLAFQNLWKARLADAEAFIEHARRCVREAPQPVLRVMVDTVTGLLALGRGAHREAAEAFERASCLGGPDLSGLDGSPHPVPLPHLTRSKALRLISLSLAGETEPAGAELAALCDEERDSEYIRVAGAALALARGDAAASADLAAAVTATPTGDSRWRILAHVIGASAADAARDTGAATRELEAALELAEPDGLLLPLLLFDLDGLLERHGRVATAHPSLIAELRDARAGRARAGHAPAGRGHNGGDGAGLAEPLSDSELRVLRYLATNLPAPEIAGELVVSVNTVRTHVNHIYSKLGVHSRSEAVEQARHLGLLTRG